MSATSLPKGVIKQAPADFVVDEIPAYDLSGDGPHLYFRFRKTNLTTEEAVRRIAQALKVDRREIGIAGLKDKVAITTQWISLPTEGHGDIDTRLRALTLEGIEALDITRHRNKLKTGHLRGNRFGIVVRQIEAGRLQEVKDSLDRMGRNGVPNAFGAQRFGRVGDTHERARAWLTGRERAPSDPRARRFQFSAWQASVFNAVLDARIADGTWNVPILGDLLKKEETGGIFTCTDVEVDRERALKGEVGPTGPLVGDKMRQPEADALALEQRIVGPLIEGIDLHRARSLGEGTRRPLRIRVADLTHEGIDDHTLRIEFTLQKGSYATTVLANAVWTDVQDERDDSVNE